MDARLQKRIMLFYLAGVINAFLGLYVLIEVKSDQAIWMLLFFFTFAGVDFWFPYAIKKKWLAEQERLHAARADTGERDGNRK